MNIAFAGFGVRVEPFFVVFVIDIHYGSEQSRNIMVSAGE